MRRWSWTAARVLFLATCPSDAPPALSHTPLSFFFLPSDLRAPSLSQSFSFGAYEYLYYAATTGGWGFKTPSTAITMFDSFGNRLSVLVRTSLNLRTFEVVSVRVLDYKFSGNNWGK